MQGVYISLALVQLQQPEVRIEGLRKRLAKAVADKHEETMARMGAAVATGEDRLGVQNPQQGAVLWGTAAVDLHLAC